MRAIPVQRLLASHSVLGAQTFIESSEEDGSLEIPHIVVFSPAMLLPAVISTARVLAIHVFGSDAVLGITPPKYGGYLGVTANVGEVDSTPEGLLRAVLMTRASDILFKTHGFNNELNASKLVDFYHSGNGLQVLMGNELQDVDASLLSEELPSL